MGFKNTLGSMRKQGRNLVLPVKKIKNILINNLQEDDIHIIDLGAGTLFWSEIMTEHCPGTFTVYAIDVIFDEKTIEYKNGKIMLFKTLDDVFKIQQKFDLVFICDVIHHLENDIWDSILNSLMSKTDTFIIKDIDANKKFGNKMNKLHDKIINKEDIVDVFPNVIQSKLNKSGFKILEVKSIPKLWYPHFLLTAKKEVDNVKSS